MATLPRERIQPDRLYVPLRLTDHQCTETRLLFGSRRWNRLLLSTLNLR